MVVTIAENEKAEKERLKEMEKFLNVILGSKLICFRETKPRFNTFK